jgi:hypothetical protein
MLVYVFILKRTSMLSLYGPCQLLLKLFSLCLSSVQITGFYGWRLSIIASRVEIDAPRGYLKPYLDTTYVYGLVFILSLMHVLDYILDRIAGLFRFN